ncbi:arylesterase [Oricola sp.]|uniref:arylesterase n=1 Tax=Oricola sp. TaxID=1979950 RepID=UPI003BA857F8
MVKACLRIFAIIGFAVVNHIAIATAEPVRGVALGDSLTAGYLLAPGEDYPAQLQAALGAAGYAVDLANAGVSGDTTSGGLERLDWSIPDGTDFVLLELGANDALRGISPDITRDNLDRMIERLQARDIDVVLIGMLAPPNLDDTYAAAFNPIYGDLAEKHGVPLYPFFLDGVIGDSSKLLADGIHPNNAGVAVMVDRTLPLVSRYLDSRSGGSGSALANE